MEKQELPKPSSCGRTSTNHDNATMHYSFKKKVFYLLRPLFFIITIKTPGLGFEPRNPCGNRLSQVPLLEAYALKAYALG